MKTKFNLFYLIYFFILSKNDVFSKKILTPSPASGFGFYLGYYRVFLFTRNMVVDDPSVVCLESCRVVVFGVDGVVDDACE